MPGAINFKIDVFIEHPELFPELTERTRDLRPAFAVIIRKWAQSNADKFEKAVGGEEGGAAVDPAVFWQPLSPEYLKRKRQSGFENHLMVRTGLLEQSLEDPERFFQETTPEQTVFGTPMSPEEEMKARFNYKRRQTIFLSVDDQRMIDATVKHYFELGEDFEQIMFTKGLQTARLRAEAKGLDIAFGDTAGGA